MEFKHVHATLSPDCQVKILTSNLRQVHTITFLLLFVTFLNFGPIQVRIFCVKHFREYKHKMAVLDGRGLFFSHRALNFWMMMELLVSCPATYSVKYPVFSNSPFSI